MRKRLLEAYMGGVALTSLGGIQITNISYTPAQMEVVTTPMALMRGERVLKINRKQAMVSIEFVMPGISPVKRQEKLNAVIEWTKTGPLSVSDRPWQRLNCICTTPPRFASAISRTERLTIGFTAYGNPFWEDENPTVASLSGLNGSGSLYVPGTAEENYVEIQAAPASGTLNELTLTVGENTIVLSGLGATSSNPLTITYENGLQKIKVGNVSVLDKRTPASADNLIARIGAYNDISFTADVLTTVQFSARGLWL